MTDSLDQCPECGAVVPGGRDGCQALWDELRTQADGGLSDFAMQGPAFDAYCMQHLEKYCQSAKSYAAHLTRLCCGLEHHGDPRVYAAIQKWLNGNVALEKPDALASLGVLTIADVYAAGSVVGRNTMARAWIESVWHAYAPQHDLARSWLKLALSEPSVSSRRKPTGK
jgi:hypothetical protein